MGRSSVSVSPGEHLGVDTIHSYHEVLEVNGEPCDPKMDSGYDDCLYAEMAAAMARDPGCSVPYLPLWARQRHPGLRVCVDADKASRAVDIFQRMSRGGVAKTCREPCKTLQVKTTDPTVPKVGITSLSSPHAGERWLRHLQR